MTGSRRPGVGGVMVEIPQHALEPNLPGEPDIRVSAPALGDLGCPLIVGVGGVGERRPLPVDLPRYPEVVDVEDHRPVARVGGQRLCELGVRRPRPEAFLSCPAEVDLDGVKSPSRKRVGILLVMPERSHATSLAAAAAGVGVDPSEQPSLV